MLPHPHGPVPLHIAVTADRAESGSGSTDVTAKEHEVHDLPDGVDGVEMLRDPHRTTDDQALRRCNHAVGRRDAGQIETRRRKQRVDVERVEV